MLCGKTSSVHLESLFSFQGNHRPPKIDYYAHLQVRPYVKTHEANVFGKSILIFEGHYFLKSWYSVVVRHPIFLQLCQTCSAIPWLVIRIIWYQIRSASRSAAKRNLEVISNNFVHPWIRSNRNCNYTTQKRSFKENLK